MTEKDVFFVTLILTGLVSADQLTECEVLAQTESGPVCGRLRPAADGDYASFRGIPYARQPLGQLRFQELQPPEPFNGIFDAREAGPVCPQIDVIFGPLAQPRSMAEDCIRINIHVPIHALPDLEGYRQNHLSNQGGHEQNLKPLLPILAWVHGGSFSYGSGDADFHGPEYLVTKGVIVVTFNYRLNALGFLSLNSKIPGNNGLRDARTALQWLQRNARFFGGDPGNVTIGGQSAGGCIAHLLSISPACKGLFNKVISLSGNAISNYITISTVYAAIIAKIFLFYLGINTLEDPETIHQQLITTPIERLVDANKFLLDQLGLVSFTPVIETPAENFTTMLPKNPDYLLDEGRGKEYPILFGFTSNESQICKKRFIHVNLEAKLRLIPVLIVPTNLLFMLHPLSVPTVMFNVLDEYFNNSVITLGRFLNIVTDGFYKYPVLRATEKRVRTRSAPTYLYEFSYRGQRSILKEVFDLDFPGAGHAEDVTYFFRVNSVQGPLVVNELAQYSPDSMMREWMTRFIASFVITGEPTPLEGHGFHRWPRADKSFMFESIETPTFYNPKTVSPYMRAKKRFFDEQYKIGLI